MNIICKTYISEVKAFFPILGKDERSYISKLRTNVDDFCDEAHISTKEELYKQYGMPIDIVHEYYSSVDTDKIISRIFLSKWIKRCLVIILILTVIASICYCLIMFQAYNKYKDEIVVTQTDQITIEN